MANYKLNLTGAEIDERLAQVPEIAEDVGALKSTIGEQGDVVTSLKEDLNELKEQGIGGGSGIPQAQKTNLAKAIRQELAFASTSHPFIDAFLAWLESGSDTPVTPPEDEPTAPTLTGITVTWSAESADVGTNPSTLISSVKANMSDGTSNSVTGYTVSPSALVEGANTVTVSYNGKTDSKTVVGIATSETDKNSVDLWENGTISPSGVLQANNSRMRTKSYIPSDITRIEVDDGWSYIPIFFNSSHAPYGNDHAYYDYVTNSMVKDGVHYCTEAINLADIASLHEGFDNCRIIFRNESSPTSAISASDALHIHLY